MTQKENTLGRAARIVCLCLVCALLGGIAGYLASGIGRKQLDRRLTEVETALNAAAEEERALTGAEIYALAQAQAVGVQTDRMTTNLFGVSTPDAVSGTGFVLREDGYILTNYHIVEKAILQDAQLSVLFSDGDRLPAEVAGYEASLDLAVLKIDRTGLRAVSPGDSGALRVGDRVYAEGNHLGELAFSQSSGSVSALDRVITAFIDGEVVPLRVFQLDAAVNSGSSGGPVYNERGEVVGVVTAKYTAGGVEGLGFAIPINDAMRAAEELIRDGRIENMPDLGARLGDGDGEERGVLLELVEADGAADRAELRAGDAVTAIDGRSVSVRSELEAVLKTYRAGETAQLTVRRGNDTMEVTVVFDRAP